MKATAAIIAIFSLLLFAGCAPARYCPDHGYYLQTGNDTIRFDSIVERETLVPVYVASDSGYLKAWIDCVKSKPVITQVQTSAGQHVAPSISQIGNTITVKCRVDSFAVFSKYREREVYRNLRTSQTVVKITNVLTGWQWFQVWAGRVAILVVLLWLVVKYGPTLWKFIRKFISPV